MGSHLGTVCLRPVAGLLVRSWEEDSEHLFLRNVCSAHDFVNGGSQSVREAKTVQHEWVLDGLHRTACAAVHEPEKVSLHLIHDP